MLLVIKLISLGTVLIGNAPVLILDEPTNELDLLKRKLVWEIIQEGNRMGTTVSLVTHNTLEAEKVVHRVAVIDHGKLLAIDQVEKLKGRVDQRMRLEIHTQEESFQRIQEILEPFGKVERIEDTRFSILVEKKAAGTLINLIQNEDLGISQFSLDETNILLFSRQQDEVIAAVSYTLGTREGNFEDKYVVFVDCVLIKREYQNSHLFVRSFRQMLQHIAKEHKEVKEVRFYAYRHHHYIHGLYKKFATIIGEREDFFGIQDVFSVEFDRLVQYLERFKREKVELYE